MLLKKVNMIYTNNSFTWIRIVVFGLAFISVLMITVSTIALYSHYGPLTPNGNRYYHRFDMDTVVWRLVVLELAAMLLLIYPSIRYSLSHNSNLLSKGIFPSTGKFGNVVSIILTVFSIGSQIIYTLSFCMIVNEYLSNHSRIMAEDLETGIQYVAYIGCILFWGFVNTVYSVKYRFKW